jgi:hypothetical protein
MDWIDMVRGRVMWLGIVIAGINRLVDIAKRLAAFERKVSRRIFGGIKVNENWRKRYNKELMQLFGNLGILSFVRISRLDWGHVKRMDSKSKVK